MRALLKNTTIRLMAAAMASIVVGGCIGIGIDRAMQSRCERQISAYEQAALTGLIIGAIDIAAK